MKLSLQTYNGTSITAYGAKIPGEHIGSQARIIDVQRVNELTAYGGKSFEATTFDLSFGLRTASRDADIEAIGKLFYVRQSTLGTLVANDTNDSNTPYYIECTPSGTPVVKGESMKIKMWASDPVWKKVTASAGTISHSAIGTTSGTITNNGNVDTYPVLTITPTSTGGAYTYRKHILVYNPVAYAQSNYPLDITSGGMDTNALVKSTAVSNTINEGAGINDSVDTWNIDGAVGGGLPAGGGVFTMESEQCSYADITAGVVSGVVRGINGTTPAAHLDNVVMYQSLLQANGNDLRPLVNGVGVSRWLGGTVLSDTTLKIWCVFDLEAKIELTLGADISGASGITTITFAKTKANATALKLLPEKGILYIDTEAIAYTAKNVTARTVTIADTGRGIKDTTAATHANGATARWIQYDIVLEYGNLNAETLVQDETRKPCFSLENSTNTNWRYDSADSVFADEAGLRSGGWKPSRPKGKYANWYGGNQGTVGTDPITNMGAEIVSYQSGSIYKTETAQIHWTLYNPAGILTPAAILEKYKYQATTPFPTFRLQSSKNGTTWAVEWTETAPSAADTWEPITHAAETLPTGSLYIRFEFTGAVNGVLGAAARCEIGLGSAGSTGVSFESAGVPQIVILSQATNAQLDMEIVNTTTGDGITFNFPLAANTPLIIDTENRTSTYQDRLLAPVEWTGNKTNRQEWLRLVPGNNAITVTDNTLAPVTVGWSYKERKNM